MIENAKVEAAVEARLAERAARNAVHPLCQGVYKNGNLCRNRAVADGLCRQHGGDKSASERAAEAARIRELEGESQRIADEQQEMARQSRVADCIYRGFTIVNGGTASRPQYQVTALSIDSAVAYRRATGGDVYPDSMGGLMRDTDCGLYEGVTVDELKRQIDDVLAGTPPEEVPAQSGDVVSRVVSPRTGEIYADITAEQKAAEIVQGANAKAAHIEAVARRKARDETLEQMRRNREQLRLEREAADWRNREQQAEQYRLEGVERERTERRERRKRLAELHVRQDAQGEQRTNLEGDPLCDSCQRVYHRPDFDFCYGCSKGRNRTDHRARVESGEVKARRDARQKVREVYMTPMRERKAQEMADAQAVKGTLNAEILFMLQGCGVDMTVGKFHDYCHDKSWVAMRPEDLASMDSVVEAAESLSTGAYAKIAPWLEQLVARMARYRQLST